jgi:hypothetical protein
VRKQFSSLISAPAADAGPSFSQKRPNLDPDALSEEGEAMDATNADEEGMMAAMGLKGFGTTKVCRSINFLRHGIHLILRASTSREIKKASPISRRLGHGVST